MPLSFFTAQIRCVIRRVPSASSLKTSGRLWYLRSPVTIFITPHHPLQILTGSQIPLAQLRNDSVDNLMGALTIAGHYIIPGTPIYRLTFNLPFQPFHLECCLYFNHTLFRGNRVSKLSSYDLHAFDSPNFPPLVKGKLKRTLSRMRTPDRVLIVGIDIVINWNDVIRQTSLRRFKAHKRRHLPRCYELPRANTFWQA